MAGDPKPSPGLVGDVGSTGIAELDDVLGGLFWGDNVVFEVADPPVVQPFYRAVAAVEQLYDQRLDVALSARPTKVRSVDAIDAAGAGDSGARHVVNQPR